MSKRKHQAGFAHLAIITVILAVALVGTLGFVFYQNFIQKKSEGVAKVSSKSDDNTKKPLDVTSDWTILSIPYFSMPIPDGWRLEKYVILETGEDRGVVIAHNGLGSEEYLRYKQGTRATIDEIKEPRDYGHGIASNFMLDYMEGRKFSGEQRVADGYTKETPISSSSGVIIEKYHKFFTERPDAVESPIVANTHEYDYHFTGKDGRDVTIMYFVIPGQDNNLDQLEQALKKVSID